MTEKELLIKLFEEAGKGFKAPLKTTRVGEWYQFVVGIDDDHCAVIDIDGDALSELCSLMSVNMDDFIE